MEKLWFEFLLINKVDACEENDSHVVNGFLLNRGRAACYVAGVTNAVAPAAASEDEKSDDDHGDENSLGKKTLKIQTIWLRIRDAILQLFWTLFKTPLTHPTPSVEGVE